MNACECMFQPTNGWDQSLTDDEKEKFMRYSFAYAYIWSICASASPTEKYLEKLDGFWKEYFDFL